MPQSLDTLNPRSALVEIARDFHRRGWMAGTAGNLSARLPQQRDNFWITASGLPKGRLDQDDFLCVDIGTGRVVEQLDAAAKPSAETAIHRVIYQLFPQTNACLHVHSIEACLATVHCTADDSMLPLPSLEMLKGLGVWEERPTVTLPLFPNYGDVTAIAKAVRERFAESPPQVPALMIHSHGATVWGDSLQEAYNRVEIIEFIMGYLARRP